MKKRLTTTADYLEEYRRLAKIHLTVDFADIKSVRKGNRAIVAMSSIAKEVSAEFADGLDTFALLLEDSETEIRYYAAFDLLHFLKPSLNVETKALNLIKERAKRENHIGYQIWLKNWEKGKINQNKQ